MTAIDKRQISISYRNVHDEFLILCVLLVEEGRGAMVFERTMCCEINVLFSKISSSCLNNIW